MKDGGGGGGVDDRTMQLLGWNFFFERIHTHGGKKSSSNRHRFADNMAEAAERVSATKKDVHN